MSKNLILLTNNYWIKEYYLDSIIPNKLKNVFLISDKNNQFISNYIKKNSLNHKFFYTKNLNLNWLKKHTNIKKSVLIFHLILNKQKVYHY